MSIGKKIKREREKRGISQKELARSLRINVCVMNRIEKGERATRDEELLKIAHYFNVSTDYLLENEEAKQEPGDKAKIDIGRQVEGMIDDLASVDSVGVEMDGCSIDEEVKQVLKHSLQNTLEFARLKAKEKGMSKK